MAAKPRPKLVPGDAARSPRGLEDALAVLDAMHDCHIESVAAARVYLLIAIGGERTIVNIAHSLSLPISTASRIVWALVDEHELLRYKPHPSGDRRKKLVELAQPLVVRPEVQPTMPTPCKVCGRPYCTRKACGNS